MTTSASSQPSLDDQLRAAIMADDEDAITKLVEQGVDIDKPVWPPFHKSPLGVAARYDKPAAVRALVRHGADVTRRDRNGRQPLHNAASFSAASIPYLLAAGAPLVAKESFGRTPLLVASGTCLQAVCSLLDAGGDTLLDTTDSVGSGPLHQACQSGKIDIVRYLLGFPASIVDIDLKNKRGATPLYSAALNRHVEIVRLLLDTGSVDVEAQIDRRTLLQAASARDHTLESKPGTPQVVVSLIEAGCRLDRANPPSSLSSLHRDLVYSLRPLLEDWFRTGTSAPIPPHRRTLRWACTSTAVEEALPGLRGGTDGSAFVAEKSAAELLAEREARLEPLRDDAWKRRRHLCLDRALWRKPAAMEPEK
jgi:ankyrin repeat protein